MNEQTAVAQPLSELDRLVEVLGKSMDLFNLWNRLVLATGFSAAARKLDWSKALSWVLLSWGVWLGAKGLWAWIWS